MKTSQRRLASILGSIGSVARLALSYRTTGRRQADRVEPLRPQANRKPSAETGSGPRGDAVQRKDAADRGQQASVPEQIPARGWVDIAKRTAAKFSENKLMNEAASVTFFALLSLFPAVTALVSIYGLFTDPSTIKSHLDSVSGFIPSGGLQIIEDQVKRLTESPHGGLSIGAAVGILAALWSANQGAKAMISALNDVYGERESRGFFKLTAVSLAFTVGGVAASLVGIALVLVLPIVFNAIGLGGAFDLLMKIARWPVMLIGLIGALALLYRFGPSRHRARWRWVTWGGVIGAVAWVVLSFGFSWYVEHFGSYNKTYGSLGAAIGFMTWIWLSSTVLLLGAQINAEMETQTAKDTTVGGEKPPGVRGAKAADTVA